MCEPSQACLQGFNPAAEHTPQVYKPLVSHREIRECAFSFKHLLVEKGFVLLAEQWENQHRDLLLTTLKNGQRTLFYLKHKKSFFRAFSAIFPKENGWGDSINLSVINKASSLGVDIIVFHHHPHFYYTFPQIIKEYCIDRNLIRVQDNGEKTLSFPASILKNFKDY